MKNNQPKPPHVGKAACRLDDDANNPREVTFALLWAKEQELGNVLRHLIGPDYSDRDAMVAATVIQWLGSDVGMCFLQDATKENKEIAKWLNVKSNP